MAESTPAPPSSPEETGYFGVMDGFVVISVLVIVVLLVARFKKRRAEEQNLRNLRVVAKLET